MKSIYIVLLAALLCGCTNTTTNTQYTVGCGGEKHTPIYLDGLIVVTKAFEKSGSLPSDLLSLIQPIETECGAIIVKYSIKKTGTSEPPTSLTKEVDGNFSGDPKNIKFINRNIQSQIEKIKLSNVFFSEKSISLDSINFLYSQDLNNYSNDLVYYYASKKQDTLKVYTNIDSVRINIATEYYTKKERKFILFYEPTLGESDNITLPFSGLTAINKAAISSKDTKKLNDADAKISAALVKNPLNYNLWYDRATNRIAANDLKKAMDYLKNAVRYSIDSKENLKLLGSIEMEKPTLLKALADKHKSTFNSIENALKNADKDLMDTPIGVMTGGKLHLMPQGLFDAGNYRIAAQEKSSDGSISISLHYTLKGEAKSIERRQFSVGAEISEPIDNEANLIQVINATEPDKSFITLKIRIKNNPAYKPPITETPKPEIVKNKLIPIDGRWSKLNQDLNTVYLGESGDFRIVTKQRNSDSSVKIDVFYDEGGQLQNHSLTVGAELVLELKSQKKLTIINATQPDQNFASYNINLKDR